MNLVGSVGSLLRKQTGRGRKDSPKNDEKASRKKRTLKQAQAVLDRLHEEFSGERVVRTSLRKYLADWLNGKEAETAESTMKFYRGSLAKFLQFLGDRSGNPIAEITKQDVVAFRKSLITQVSAKTANHDLKALKMQSIFRSASRREMLGEHSRGGRRDGGPKMGWTKRSGCGDGYEYRLPARSWITI